MLHDVMGSDAVHERMAVTMRPWPGVDDWVYSYCLVSRTVDTFVTGMRSATWDRERAGFRDAVICLHSPGRLQSRVSGSLGARAWRAVCNRQLCIHPSTDMQAT